MLKHSYAFIIGAGAAKPYDFPTGPELYNQIRKNYLGYIRSCVSNANLLLEERNLIKRAEYFIQELGLTNSVSIDKYININPKFNEHGVCAIAAQIYTCECKSKLPPLCNPETDWYSWLYAKMIEGINSPSYLLKLCK